MFLRLSAIAVFSAALSTLLTGAVLAWPVAANAEDIAKHYKVTEPPQPVPPFIFEDGNGVTHDLKEYKGRFVLLNLWATWCSPCVKEMPSLNSLQEQLDPHNATIVALNEDRSGVSAAQNFYSRHDLKNLPIYIDASGQAPFILHTPGLPVTLLINPKGIEIGRVEGEADWNTSDSVTFLQRQMKP